MSGKEAFSFLPVGGNIMSQMDFFSLTPAAILKIYKGWELSKTGGNRCIYPKLCRQPSSQTGSSPKPVGLWRLSALSWNLHSLFITPFLGIHKQTPSTAQSTLSSALLQPFAGIKRFSTSCSRKKSVWPGWYCWSRKAKLYEEWRENQEKEGQARRVTQQMRWQTRSRCRPSRLVKHQHYQLHSSFILPQDNSHNWKHSMPSHYTSTLRAHSRPGWPLKKDQARGSWITSFKLQSVNLQCLWNTTGKNNKKLGDSWV